LEYFSSGDLELRPMAMTYKSDLDMVEVNQHAKYLRQRSFLFLCDANTDTHIAVGKKNKKCSVPTAQKRHLTQLKLTRHTNLCVELSRASRSEVAHQWHQWYCRPTAGQTGTCFPFASCTAHPPTSSPGIAADPPDHVQKKIAIHTTRGHSTAVTELH